MKLRQKTIRTTRKQTVVVEASATIENNEGEPRVRNPSIVAVETDSHSSVLDKNNSRQRLRSAMGYKERIQQLEKELKESAETVRLLNEAVKVLEKEAANKGGRQDKEKIKKLEEELKKANETIHEQNEILKPQTAQEMPDIPEDDDCCVRVGQIVQKLYDMDTKMDKLSGEVVEDMKNNKDIKCFSVTSFGYFANVLKSYERNIPEKLLKMEEAFTQRFEILEKQHEETIRKYDSVRNYMASVEGALGSQLNHMRKLQKASEDHKGELEHVARFLARFVDGMNTQTINMAIFKEDVNSKLERIENRDAESDYICRQCRTGLPKYILFNEDGVSVKCPSCDTDNIVAKLQDKMKWIRFDGCERVHIHQISKKVKKGKNRVCPSCEKQGKVVELNDWMALPSWSTEHLRSYDSGQGLLFRLFNNPVAPRPCVVRASHSAECSAAHSAHAAHASASTGPSTANGTHSSNSDKD